LTLGFVVLTAHLAGLESFGKAYLSPFSALRGAGAVIRPRLDQEEHP